MASTNPLVHPVWNPYARKKNEAQPSLFMSLALAAGVVAGAVALGVYALDWHGHQCESCGNKWHHLGAFNIGDPGSHTCARCGTVQWWKDGVPHVFRDSIRNPPVDPRAERWQKLRELQEATAAARGGG